MKNDDSFDLELEKFNSGNLPDSHIFNLGKPGEILQNCGFPAVHRIELAAARLRMKANQGNHPFEILDIQGLAGALQKPVAVFEYGDKNKSQNVIVNIEKDGKNFLVGVFFNQIRDGFEVSSIRGLFNRDNMDWMHWIQQGKMIYGNKEKIQVLAEQQRTNLADVHSKEARTSSDSYYLDSVDNILQSFGDVKDIYTKDFPKYAEQKERFEIFKKFRSAYQEVNAINALNAVQEADEFYDALKSNNKEVIARYTDAFKYPALADTAKSIIEERSFSQKEKSQEIQYAEHLMAQGLDSLDSNKILHQTNSLDNKTTSTLVIDSNQAARIKAAREIKENMPNLSEKERAAAIAILEAGAKSQDMEFSEYVEKTFPDGIFGDIEKAENAAKQQGVKINGAVSVNGFGENVRAVIYAGKNADFSTWCHELSHIWQAQLTGELKQNAEEAFQVKDSDWQNSIYTFKDGHTDTSAEAFAYGFEDFLKNKAGEMAAEDKKKIFEKFADYMSRTYNGIKQHIEINEKIASVYQKFVELDDNILAQAEKAVRLEIEQEQKINEIFNSPNFKTSQKVSETIGLVSDKFAALASQYRYDIKGYSHTIDNFFVNHALKQHGDKETEEKRGNVAITYSDICNVFSVYTHPDYIVFGTKTKTGNPAIVYVKNIGDSTIFVEDVRRGKKELAAQTLYKKSGTIDVSSKKEAPELYAHSDPESISIVDVKKEFVNESKNEFLQREKKIAQVESFQTHSPSNQNNSTDAKNANISFQPVDDSYTLFQSAYHGSSANFDKFNTSEYGLSGDGAMAFGYGVYVSNSETIARSYAGIQGERNLYTVEIPDGDYIIWNKTVSKLQKEKAKNELYENLIKEDYKGVEKEISTELNNVFSEDFDGKKLYGTISSYIGSDKETSRFFKDIGYSGIQYPAGTPENAVNYVIFDDNDIKIKNHFQFQIIGELGARELDRNAESNERIANLETAKRMEEAEKDANAIRLATGWEKGADGKWKYEIDDSKVHFNLYDAMEEWDEMHPRYEELREKFFKTELSEEEQKEFDQWVDERNEVSDKHTDMDFSEKLLGKTFRLPEVMRHNELFKAYPELKYVTVSIKKTGENGTLGNASYEDKHINLYRHEKDTDGFEEWEKKAGSVLLHEVQHIIQGIEGFAKGASPEMFEESPEASEQSNALAGKIVADGKSFMSAMEAYRASAGEVESRNVQTRMRFTPKQRINTLLSDTADIAPKDQIVMFDVPTSESRDIKNTNEERSVALKADSKENKMGNISATIEAEIRSQEKDHHEVEEYNDGQLPLQVVAHTDFNYFNSDKLSFKEYIVRTDASVVQDLIEKNADSFNETNSKLEENAIPCIIVRKSVNPEIPDQFLLSKYENNNLNKDEIAKQAGKFASKEIKIENTELITQIKNVIDWNDKQNKTQAAIPELKIYHTLKEDEENISQAAEKSINEQKTKLQIIEQEDKEQLAAIVMTARKTIKESLAQKAEPLVEVDFSKANYDRLFPFGIVQTPLEKVKLGENQFEKLDAKDRKRFLLATFQTLATPDLVIDEEREGKHSHNYIKSFVFDEKTKTIQDVVVNINGENVSITAHPRDINNIVNKIKMPDQLVYAAARVGQVIEQRVQNELGIVNPTRDDRLSTISVPLNKEYNENFALSTVEKLLETEKNVQKATAADFQQIEPALQKKFDKLKAAIKSREEQDIQDISAAEEPGNKKKAIRSKSDIIRQAGKDFLKSVKEGIAPFFNAEDDFQRIIMHPQAIINASNGLPFSGESQLLAQIYHQRQRMEGEVVTSIAGAKAAGTIVLDTPESRQKNFALTDTSSLAEKNAIVRTRYFMPESCEEPDKIYAHTLQRQRPDKIRSYRDLIRHFENIPNGQKEISDIRIRIAHEHLKEIQSRFAIKEKRVLSVDEIEERKNFLRNYFERLPTDYRNSERSAFEDTFGIQLNSEKNLEINLQRDFKDIDFAELKKNTKKSIELENRKLSDFIEKNTMENKKLATLLSDEYKSLSKEEKMTVRNLKIEAIGIKEPETFLGKYLAACNTNAEFITDKETVEEVKKNLVKKLEENFKLEKYDILKEIGQQAQSIGNETTKKISFEKAHSNNKSLEKTQSPDKEISLIGMGK